MLARTEIASMDEGLLREIDQMVIKAMKSMEPIHTNSLRVTEEDLTRMEEAILNSLD